MKLSILICSLHSRAHLLQRLLTILQPQVILDEVEIITNIDERTKSIGSKRNELLEQATGDYVAFVDDDDLVAHNYICRILQSISSNPDCCGIEGIITIDGSNPKKFIHSLQYKSWFEKDNIYYRNPNHLSPVRREHALNAKFPDINFGEDQEYSVRLLPHLKIEVYISGPIYYYEYLTSNAKAPLAAKPRIELVRVPSMVRPLIVHPPITKPPPNKPIQTITPKIARPKLPLIQPPPQPIRLTSILNKPKANIQITKPRFIKQKP